MLFRPIGRAAAEAAAVLAIAGAAGASSLTTTTVFEVQSGGSDSNGGGFDATLGGTDYTQGAGQKTVAFDGTTITASNGAAGATITLSGYTVVGGDIGNVLHITGGTNFTAGWYTIVAVNGGSNTWTLNGNVTTGAGSGMTGTCGGALGSPGGFMAVANGSGVCYVKAATYTLSASANVSGGRLSYSTSGALSMLIGYSTNRVPFNTDTRPVFQPGANSVTLISLQNLNTQDILNIDMQNPSGFTGCTGINGNSVYVSMIYNVRVQNIKTGIIAIGSGCSITSCAVINASDTANPAIQTNGNGGGVYGCTVVNSPGGIQSATGNLNSPIAANCLVAGNAGSGYAFNGFRALYNCAAYSITGTNQDAYGPGVGLCMNCIAQGAARYGFNGSGQGDQFLINCSGYGNGTANYNAANYPSWRVSGFVALSASPFASPGTTTAADFTITASSGLRNTAVPSTWPGISSTNYGDPGPIRHQDPAGGGGFRPRPRTGMTPDRPRPILPVLDRPTSRKAA